MISEKRIRELEERVAELEEYVDAELQAEYNEFVKWRKKLSTKIKMYFKYRHYKNDGEDY